MEGFESMKNIKISDMTLCRNNALSFKERIEIARLFAEKIDDFSCVSCEKITFS